MQQGGAERSSGRRPTVLIAVGSFGMAVAKRLLVESALRGRLSWREAGDLDGERRLQDLGILALPEVDEPTGPSRLDGDGSAALELMRDLDRQIIGLDDGAPERVLAEAVVEMAAGLLSARRHGEQPGALPQGLDVVVLARPLRAEAIGWLERVLLPALEKLDANLGLNGGGRSADALALLQILDFENWWSADDAARGLRTALAASAARWQERSLLGKTSFGRIYLVDGRSREGVKSARERADEVVLFLELLLFEGQRGGQLQRLYQPRRLGEGPLATLGVRAFERSSQLLSRLAAATFALGWLDHLEGGRSGEPGGETALDRLLAPLTEEGLRSRLGLTELSAVIEEDFSRLESELETLAPELPDWPAQVADRCRVAGAALELRLQVEVGRSMTLQGEWLSRLPEQLAAAVDADLQHAAHPASLRATLAHLQNWRQKLSPGGQLPPSPAGDESAALASLTGLHDRFRDFLRELLDLARLSGFWPLWAMALAVGAAPQVLELLLKIRAPDPAKTPWLLVQAFQGLTHLMNPLAVGLVLLLLAFLLGLLRIQPWLSRAAERGRQFFEDRQRGRFAGALRRELGRGGGLREPVEQRLDRVARDVVASVRGRIVRELGTLERRLTERRRELSWLRDQLAELLRVHGFDAGAGGVLPRRRSGVLLTAESEADLAKWLATNPAVADRFRSMQANEKPFEGWHELYGGIFLQPLEFLDRLSRRFRDPELDAAAKRESGPEEQARGDQLAAFIEGQKRFGLAFAWQKEGTPVEELLCLAPRAWLHLPGVAFRLRDIGLVDEKTLELEETTRLYLLRVQVGVNPEYLEGRIG